MKPEQKSRDAMLLKIAMRNIVAIEDDGTLEIRGSDSLDFHDVSVWGLKKALLEAYELGKKSR